MILTPPVDSRYILLERIKTTHSTDHRPVDRLKYTKADPIYSERTHTAMGASPHICGNRDQNI